MRSLEFLEPSKDNFGYYVSFLIFEPSSQRVQASDILLKGPQVKALFDKVMQQMTSDTSLKNQIILNRLNRLNMMLELVKSYDSLLLTKFLNKVWRRYTFFSNLGEIFLELDEFTKYLPEYESKDTSLYIPRASVVDDDPE